MRATALLAPLFGALAAAACHASPNVDPPGSGGVGGAGTTSTTTTESASTTSTTSASTTTVTIAPCNQGAPEVCNPFGIDLEVPPLDGGAYWGFITDVLKVPFYRPGTLTLDTGAACPRCVEAVQEGRLLVLVVRANGEPGTPTIPPKDLSMYQHQLGELLDAHEAAVAAVVIEEGAEDHGVWGGSVSEYLALVTAGCEVAHQRGVMCAEGGLGSTTMVLLLADYHASSGSVASAIQIVTAAGDNPEVKAAFPVWPPVTAADLAAGLGAEKARLDAAKALFAGVREAGVDMVNFKWYERDQDSLDNAMALARSLSGCNSLMTSDMGQRTQDAAEVVRKAQDAAELGMRLVIWSSRAESGAALSCDGAGAPTESGAALAGLSAGAMCGD